MRAPRRAAGFSRCAESSSASIVFIPRFEFYARARQALAVVATGDTKKYGNILLKKWVTPVAAYERG